jgi:hypothetical protein
MSFIGEAVMMRRVMRIASSVTSRSSCAVRKLNRTAGGVRADFEVMWMLPVLSERRIFMIAVMPDCLASWKSLVIKNGTQDIAASGASSPARVRIYARIGAAGRPSSPLWLNAYISACFTLPRPRILSL